MSDLFPDLPPTLSPRLAWLAQYGLTVRRLGENRFEGALAENIIKLHTGRGQEQSSQNPCCIILKSGLTPPPTPYPTLRLLV